MVSGVERFLSGLASSFLSSVPPVDPIIVLGELCAHIASRLGAPVPHALRPNPEVSGGGINFGRGSDFDDLDDDACTPDLLGLAWEQLMSAESRRTQGAHFTPRSLAERVVEQSLDARGPDLPGSIWDPAAGGGAFLLAAARAIEERSGESRSTIVSALYASDLDPVAMRVCDATLELWSRGSARPHTAVADALLDLPDDWPRDFELIVGNPPFLGQLTSDTARSPQSAERLGNRYGALAGGYVDQAGLFVVLGLEHLAAGGALGVVLPQSLLGARDAAPIRASAQNQSRLASLWIDDGRTFSAAVEVVALVLVMGKIPEQSDPHQRTTRVTMGDGAAMEVPTPTARTWAPLLAAAQGIPVITSTGAESTVSDFATATAGFRQHFYGIADAVIEEEPNARPGTGRSAALMTAGTIDPLANLWGTRPVKFAGNTWAAPKLAIDRIAEPDVRQWFEDRLVPKLLLASQTAVLEVVVDPDGTLVPSVPVISIEPDDPEMLWHLAAALSAPSTCARLLADAAGTGLSSGAIRVSARAVAGLELPKPSPAWDSGARAAERAQLAWANEDVEAYQEELLNLASAMAEAYGDQGRLVEWWLDRLPKRNRPNGRRAERSTP